MSNQEWHESREDPHRRKRQTSTARINRLASIRSATRYLEIGVAGGKTFIEVDIETKHAVDPHSASTPARTKPRPFGSFPSPRMPISPARFRPTSGSTSSSSTGCTPSSRPCAISARRCRIPIRIRSGSSTTSSPATSSPLCPPRKRPTRSASSTAGTGGAGMATSTSASSRSTISSRTSASAPSRRARQSADRRRQPAAAGLHAAVQQPEKSRGSTTRLLEGPRPAEPPARGRVSRLGGRRDAGLRPRQTLGGL